MFLCSCENCKFNISNVLNKVTFCGEECSIVFPCLEDEKYKFSYTYSDFDKFQMAQQVLMNVNIPEDVYYSFTREPENIFNAMHAYAGSNNLIIKTFCPESGYFSFHTTDGDEKTDISKIDGQPDCFEKFSLPYYVVLTRNIGYKMGQHVYVASQRVYRHKIFTKFLKISDYDLDDLWIYPWLNECEVPEDGTLGRMAHITRLCNHRKKASCRTSRWRESYNHRKK